jgi:uncharacterized protein (TIGR02145 family)
MKNLIKILSAVLLVTAINACALQEAPDSTTQGAIVVTAQTVQEQAATSVPETKTTLSGEEGLETHWVEDSDQIGLFSPQAKATSGGTPETDPANNLAFMAQTSAKSSGFSGSIYWGSESNHDFYAYYPYDSEYSGNYEEVPISLTSAQTQSAANNMDHIGDLDYMVGTDLDVAKEGQVSLEFNHVFAMLEFQIKGTGTLTQINLIGADTLACEGTINLDQTPGANPYAITTSSTSNFVSVTLGGTGAALSTETAVSVYMMVLPGEQSGNIEIALKIGGNWKILDKTPPTDGFARGQKYVVSLNTGSAGWYSTMTDSRDSNVYDLVVIGGQVWMKENLAYISSEVGVVGPGTGSTSTPYCYVYGYDGTDVAAAKANIIEGKNYYTTYGVLYNWTAANTACPTGWHLPSDAEWKQLEMALGMSSEQANNTGDRGTTEGGKLKETGTDHWTPTNEGATNSSGFTALPGGSRSSNGAFYDIGNYGCWWSSTEYYSYYARYRRLGYGSSTVSRSNNANETGFSVRCLRD